MFCGTLFFVFLQEEAENMITTILWDVDGTLLDFAYSEAESLKKCFESAGLSFSQEILERYSQINDNYWKRLEKGEVTKQQLLYGRFFDLFEEYGIKNVDVHAFRREYQEALGTIYAYLDDSLSLCTALKGKVDQYVITNGVTATQESKLHRSGLADCMEKIFISEQIGTPKPGKAFFDAVLEQIREKDRTRILVVGDSLTSDIQGGILAGLKTCWYRKEGTINNTRFLPDFEIHDLHQVLALLEVE